MKSIERGVHFLERIQTPDGAIADTINPLFNTWETLLATDAMYTCRILNGQSSFTSAVKFLRESVNDSGLVCHNQKCKRSYCLETTAYYYCFLRKVNDTSKSAKVIDQINSLQRKGGYWEIGNPDVLEQKAFPSVTAWVLCLQNLEVVKTDIGVAALDWLFSKQLTAGHWGTAWEYYDCSAYALWVCLKAISHKNDARTKLVKQKAVNYILKSQLPDGSWFEKSNMPRHTSSELQTAMMLLALQEAGVKNDKSIQNGIDFLLKKQQANGSWDGGNFPVPDKRYKKEEYVVATSLALLALHHHFTLSR